MWPRWRTVILHVIWLSFNYIYCIIPVYVLCARISCVVNNARSNRALQGVHCPFLFWCFFSRWKRSYMNINRDIYSRLYTTFFVYVEKLKEPVELERVYISIYLVQHRVFFLFRRHFQMFIQFIYIRQDTIITAWNTSVSKKLISGPKLKWSNVSTQGLFYLLNIYYVKLNQDTLRDFYRDLSEQQ